MESVSLQEMNDNNSTKAVDHDPQVCFHHKYIKSSLSTTVLNSRDWYEIIWLPENFVL